MSEPVYCEDCQMPMEHMFDRDPDYSIPVADKVAELVGCEIKDVSLPRKVSFYKCPICNRRKVEVTVKD